MVEPYSPPTPEGYDGRVADRAELLITLGAGSLVGTALSIWGIIAAGYCCACVPGPVLTLSLSVPTWFMAAADLEGIRRGNIGNRGTGPTQTALILGILGTIGGLVAFAVLAISTMGFFR